MSRSWIVVWTDFMKHQSSKDYWEVFESEEKLKAATNLSYKTTM